MADIEVPWQSLSEEALRGLVEEYVLREGTDYGHSDYSLSGKVDAVMRQIESGHVLIHYDSYLQSCTLSPK